jgi:hypothetical protein
MSKEYRTNDEYSGDGNPQKTPNPGDDASARKIIADYLDQVKARLPAEVAAEVIPELRSHLMEQASQPSGELTSAAAWEAVVAMGSPDIVAREFRRESETHDIDRAQSFLDALTPRYRQMFWWIIVGIVIADLVLIAYIISVVLINITTTPWQFFGPWIMTGVVAQVWVFAGIAISYLVMLLLSHPEGAPLSELLRNIFREVKEKEDRIPRTKRRVQKRVKKFNELTGRTHLMGKTIGHIIGITVAIVFAIMLPILIPTYPIFDIQVLYWLAIIGLTNVALTVIRILVGDSSLAAARLLASIDVLYGLVGLWTITLFFYGPLSFPVPFWNAGQWFLFYWKPYVMLVAWIAPLLILLVIVGMTIELIQVNVYIQPLYNGYTITTEDLA